MLSWQQGRAKVIEVVRARMGRPRRETLPLDRALGRVLAAPALADRDQPAFDRSTRDGFAVRSADAVILPAALEIVGEIKAGSSFDGVLAPGQAARIMTGAAIPPGADAVVMVEHAAVEGEKIRVERPVRAGQHIVARGSEAAAGQKLLEAGTRIGFPEMALLAHVGAARVRVYLQPRVAVLTTGDELVPFESVPGPFQIRDTNSLSIGAQIRLAGGRPFPVAHAADTREAIGERMREGLVSANALVVSGGVSMGRYDLVEVVLAELGAEFFLDGLAIRPGRPAVFGWCCDRPVFGLPGNPVSTMVTFELLVTPALDLLGGAEPRPLPLVHARLEEALDEAGGLTHFLPARLTFTCDGLAARAVQWRGSGDLAGLAQSNGFLVVPAERPRWQAGETIEVLLRRDLI